ncbi:MAG: hypothetical protein OXB84_07155 [Halobacteriovoraceae bacterium]|nr:hypothetical protein [Halobacteriovoraceae bacterium]
MKNLKKPFWAVCAVVFAPIFFSNVKGNEYLRLDSGCYKVIDDKKVVELCIDGKGEIIPSNAIEEIDVILRDNPEPVSICD